MIDRYTQIVLTVIACALVALVVRPVWEPRVSHAGALNAAKESGVDHSFTPAAGHSAFLGQARCRERRAELPL